jgi:hypothetical protein
LELAWQPHIVRDPGVKNHWLTPTIKRKKTSTIMDGIVYLGLYSNFL